jgi:thiol-disulfide isomerase/thioredoxin
MPFERLHTPSLGGATEWLNSEPLGPAELRGHVVLVDFWTLTCINWLRTAPYIRAWSEAYRNDGLVVIGVHTPEFSIEHEIDRVRRATREREIDYPVAVDTDYEIWNAFDNHYWPALYFLDQDGIIRDNHFGEGRYEWSEGVIQRMLGIERELVSVEGLGVEAEADWDSLRTPETYLGLSGDWTVEREAAMLNAPDGRVVFRFHARDLHLVMAPPGGGTSVPFRVLIDGRPPATDHGIDVNEQGHGTVTEPRLYQLIRQRGDVTDRTFEIAFLEPGVEVYVFTFG